MKCVACDNLIDDHATDQEMCFVCLSIIKEPTPTIYKLKSSPVRTLTREEILEIYKDGKYEP